MRRVIFKKIAMPQSVSEDEKIRILTSHINELQTNLELVFDSIKNKLEEEGDANVS